MNADQNSQHHSDEAVVGVLDKYASVWQGNTAMAAARTQLKNGIQFVVSLAGTQATITTGIVDDKTTARRQAADAAMLVCGAVQNYADEQGNHELFAKVNFKLSDLTHGPEDESETNFTNILAVGTDNLAAIAPSGSLAQADLDDLKTKSDRFAELITKPRQAKAGTKGATNQLPTAQLANRRTIDRRILPLMKKYKTTNPDFYQEMQVAAVIVDPSYRKRITTPAPSPTPPTP